MDDIAMAKAFAGWLEEYLIDLEEKDLLPFKGPIIPLKKAYVAGYLHCKRDIEAQIREGRY